MKRIVSFVLFLLLLAGLSTGVCDGEASPTAPEDIGFGQAMAIAAEQMAQIEGISLYDVDVDCIYLTSTGDPATVWQITFFPKGNESARRYAFAIDPASGEIVTSGWWVDAGDWDRPGYQLAEKEEEALERAQAEVCAFFGLDAEGLLSLYTPQVSEMLSEGVACYQVYWLPNDAQTQGDHYFALVSAEMGTVIRILHSSMNFG